MKILQDKKHPNATHGMFGTTEYRIWSGIMDRCTNRNSKYWDRYGGAGIGVCKQWRKFEGFYKDMGNRPSAQLSVDRIDNEKGYSPENCRWASKKEQARNRKNNKYITHDGETHCIAEWGDILGMCPKMLRTRIFKHGWDIERAFTTPPRKRG